MRESDVETLRGSVRAFLEKLAEEDKSKHPDSQVHLVALEGSLSTALKKLDYMIENMDLDTDVIGHAWNPVHPPQYTGYTFQQQNAHNTVHYTTPGNNAIDFGTLTGTPPFGNDEGG
jgi:hypothetical protein